MSGPSETDTPSRAPWIEPEVRYLDVAETALFPGRGRDGQPNFPDCTRS